MGDVVEMKAGKAGKKVELNVLERLVLLNILPREGNFLNLKLVRLVREELSFTEEENKALQFRQEDQMIRWNTDACPDKEFVFGETIEGLIVKGLQDLDKAEKITEEQYSLYEKFMEGHETTG